MVEAHGPRRAGPEQGLAHLAAREVIHLVVEEPRPAVAHARSDDARSGSRGDDARRFAGRDALVRLAQDFTPTRRVALERRSGCHFSDGRFSSGRAGTSPSGAVGDDDHQPAVQFNNLDAILAALLVGDGDGSGLEGEHGNA